MRPASASTRQGTRRRSRRAHAPDPLWRPSAWAGTRQTDIEAARLLLDRMGLSVNDLLAAPADRPPAPTFAEYIPIVSAGISTATLQAYQPYWNRLLARWADRRLDEHAAAEEHSRGSV